MSKRSHHSATQGIRAWTTEQLQQVLTDNGLEECCEAIEKRSVDGDLFLTLTEGQLALWKRDLSLSTIKKLARFVQDVITNPEKYVQREVTVIQNTYIPPAVPTSPIRNGSPMSDTASWDTDFDDDLATSPVAVKPPEIEDDVDYANSEAAEFIEKPPIPERPLVLPPKPIQSVSPPVFNLPKPPVIPEDDCYGHVSTLVNDLNLEDNANEPDEEEYESLNDESLVEKLKKCLEQRRLGGHSPTPPTIQSSQSTILPTESGIHPSTYPHPKKPLNEGQVLQGNVNDGFDCDEYESINEQDKPPNLVPGNASIEYYLQPVKPSEQNGAPPLPAKLWNKPQVATLPSASPPRKKSDDSSISPGNSGDGVAWGGLSEFFRKNIRRPSASTPPETRERTPTPELKKTPTINHKPPPPPVDLRPSTFPNNHRPLPPTPEDSKTNAVAGSRRGSKVSLTQQPWYHNVDRKQGEVLLQNGEDGSFLVRPSAQSQNALTLMLRFNKWLYNINIRHRNDGRYALGTEKPNEQSFNSVEELVQNYQSEKLVLYSGGERKRTGRTLLTSSPPQSNEPSA